MSETKFTKSPWRVDFKRFNREFLASGAEQGMCSIIGADGQFLATMENAEEFEANARLFQAAPELYEACATVLAYLDKLENEPDSGALAEIRRRIHSPLRAKLEPALAKAEGR